MKDSGGQDMVWGCISSIGAENKIVAYCTSEIISNVPQCLNSVFKNEGYTTKYTFLCMKLPFYSFLHHITKNPGTNVACKNEKYT